MVFPNTVTRSAVADINGTAASAGQLSPLQGVVVSIGQVVGPATSYWDGGGYNSGTEIFVPTAFVGYTSGTWSLATTPLTTGLRYLLRSKTTDFAGNVENFAAVPQTVFLFDLTKPTAAVVNLAAAPPSAYQRAMNPVTGSAWDGPSVSSAGLAALAAGGVQARILETNGASYNYWSSGVGLFNQPDGGLAWFNANSGTPLSWSYSHAALDGQLVSGRNYLVQTRAADAALPSNVGPTINGVDSLFTLSKDSVPFTFDNVPAASTVTTPLPGAVISALASISGTAADALSGMANGSLIAVSLQEIAPGGAYWTVVVPGTFTLSGAEPWYPISTLTGGAFACGLWSFTAPLFTDQFTYRVRVRAKDNAQPGGNLQPVVSSVTFTIDSSLPSASVTYPIGLPASQGNLKALTVINGAAADQFGIQATSVSIQHAGTLKYYDPGTGLFNSTPAKYLGATMSSPGCTNCTWTLAAVSLADNSTYTIVAVGWDVSGNPSPPSAPVQIRFDTTPPTSGVVAPLTAGFIKDMTTVTGTAADPNIEGSQVAGSQINIQRGSDSNYWTGAGWNSLIQWLTPAAGSPWTVASGLPPSTNNDTSGLKDGRQYTISVRAFDVAGNTQTVILGGNSFNADFSSPTALVQLPVNGSRKNTLPVLSGTAQDTDRRRGPADGFQRQVPEIRIYDATLNKY